MYIGCVCTCVCRRITRPGPIGFCSRPQLSAVGTEMRRQHRILSLLWQSWDGLAVVSCLCLLQGAQRLVWSHRLANVRVQASWNKLSRRTEYKLTIYWWERKWCRTVRRYRARKAGCGGQRLTMITVIYYFGFCGVVVTSALTIQWKFWSWVWRVERCFWKVSVSHRKCRSNM